MSSKEYRIKLIEVYGNNEEVEKLTTEYEEWYTKIEKESDVK